MVKLTEQEKANIRKERSKTIEQKIRTANHIVNTLMDSCIVKFSIKQYIKDELFIVDVALAHFLNSNRQKVAIRQVSTQLMIPMLGRRNNKFELLNFFDWEVVSDNDDEYGKCYIRFTINELPYVGLFICNTCGEITNRTYGGKRSLRHCLTCGYIELDEYKHTRDF